MSRLKIMATLALLGLVAVGFFWKRSEMSGSPEIPSSERQMPDFNPPVESDRPDLWEEPRIRPEEPPG